MKEEYDFSKADRGKFFQPDAAYSFPVYLEPDVDAFLRELADKKQVDFQKLVNEILRADMKFIENIL